MRSSEVLLGNDDVNEVRSDDLKKASLDTNRLLQTLAAPTDTAVLGRALLQVETLGEQEPLLPALLRGMNAKKEILQAEGGIPVWRGGGQTAEISG